MTVARTAAHYGAGALRLSPGLKRSSLIGGIRYYDTVVDDAGTP